MNLLIAGCGSVGAALATQIDAAGHAVSIIDINPDSFENLGEHFHGIKLVGNTIDLDFLREAGIEGCDAVAAMTSADNVNVMLSQVAHEVFGIEKVLTRIRDPDRAKIFAQFGLHTVCPTALTISSAAAALTERSTLRHVSLLGQDFCLLALAPQSKELGVAFCSLEDRPGELLCGILRRDGSTLLRGEGAEAITINPGDRLLVLRHLKGEETQA